MHDAQVKVITRTIDKVIRDIASLKAETLREKALKSGLLMTAGLLRGLADGLTEAEAAEPEHARRT